jgi:hypothetical protein
VAPEEYEVILCALEAAAAGGVRLPSHLQRIARDVWERLIVEGGHVGLQEFQRLRRLYPPEAAP